MTLSLFDAGRKKKLQCRYAWIIFSVALFYAVVCTPVYLWSMSDILVLESVFPLIWDVIMSIISYCFYWVSFAFLLYFCYCFTAKHCKGIFGIYAGAVAFRYAASLLAANIMQSFSDFSGADVGYLLLDVALDILQMAAVWGVSYLLMNPAQREAISAYSIAKFKGSEEQLVLPQWMPFIKAADRKNALQRSAFIAALIPSAIKLGTRIFYDILQGGAKGTADLIWMIAYYISDIISILLGYLVIVLILGQIYSSCERSKRHYEESVSGRSV